MTRPPRVWRSVVRPIATGLLAALAFAGCGSAANPVNESQAVARAAHEYGKAFADGDYGHACDLMTGEGKVNLEKAAVFLGSVGGCEDALKAVGKQLDPAAKAKLRDAPIVA